MSSTQEKVIVIGAGIIGLMTALELAEQGYQVEIFDQHAAAQEASWAGGGILSPLYPWKYAPAVNHLARYGREMYQAWNLKIQTITGIDFEIEQVGLLIFDQAQYTQALAYAQDYSDIGQAAVLMQGTALKSINPHIAKASGIYFPHIANIRNPRLTQSLLKYLSLCKNIVIRQYNAITSLVLDEKVIHAVQDSQGVKHRAAHYVIAAGAWSAPLLQQCGVQTTIQPVHGQMVLYKTPAKWLPTICMNQTMYLIPRRDGHIVCGSSTQNRGFDKTLQDDVSQKIITASLELVPELAQFPIVKQWSGLRPGSPEGIPSIGRVKEIENLWLNVGHYRNGLVMAPASARLLVELMQGEKPFVEASPYACN